MTKDNYEGGLKIKTLIGICTGLLAAIIIVVALSISIKEVRVSGEEWYTADQIEEKVLSGPFDKNSIYAFVKNNLLNKKEEIPFVEDYKISFTSPTSVEIIVYEKSITGYVKYMNSYMYFDKDGIIVESSFEPLDGVPEITGLEFGSIVLFRKLPVADSKVFDDILNLTQLLSINGIMAEKIEFSGIREATLYIGGIKVVLGADDYLSEKISELRDMMPSLSGLSGTLYLDSYDPNVSNPMYTFKKK